MVAVSVVVLWFLILVVSHDSKGEIPWRFWTFQDGDQSCIYQLRGLGVH